VVLSYVFGMEQHDFFVQMTKAGIGVNSAMCVFNLIPVPPLDGFGVLGLLGSEDMARRIQNFGRSLGAFSMIGLLVAWQVFGPMFQPVFSFALHALYPGQGYAN
jgi:Zn-dependent protease